MLWLALLVIGALAAGAAGGKPAGSKITLGGPKPKAKGGKGAAFVPMPPVPDLAFFVMKAAWPTPVAIVDAGAQSIISPKWHAIADAGRNRINGKKVSDDAARELLFDRLWDVIAIGVDANGGWAGFDHDLAKNSPALERLEPLDIITLAIAWELSARGPTGGDNGARVKRLLDRIEQLIATPACDKLGARRLFGQSYGWIYDWHQFGLGGWSRCEKEQKETGSGCDGDLTMGGDILACASLQGARRGELAELIDRWEADSGLSSTAGASSSQLLELVNRLATFVRSLAIQKMNQVRGGVGWPRGYAPAPRVDWFAVLTWAVSAIVAAATLDIEGVIDATATAAEGGDAGIDEDEARQVFKFGASL